MEWRAGFLRLLLGDRSGVILESWRERRRETYLLRHLPTFTLLLDTVQPNEHRRRLGRALADSARMGVGFRLHSAFAVASG